MPNVMKDIFLSVYGLLLSGSVCVVVTIWKSSWGNEWLFFYDSPHFWVSAGSECL